MIPSRNEDPTTRPLLIENRDFHGITEDISAIAESKPAPTWLLLFMFCGSLLLLLTGMLGYLFWQGIGVWGENIPVGWGWDIINFVWWVGIAHAGTLISAILYLCRQRWRTAIARLAEATTVFGLLCAGLYPACHIGRVWMVYYLFPIPNQMAVWPNMRSPLLWDVVAVTAYLTLSSLFWYMGMIPDLATLRDRATGKVRQIVLGILSLGWRGSARHWLHYERAYLILSGIATSLVFAVSGIVSIDLAASKIPGWHTAIFPPYFVVGALCCGFAFVTAILIVTREVFGFKHLIRPHHIENTTKFTLLMCNLIGYIYLMEICIAWYSGNVYERFAFWDRATGAYGWAYCIMISCNVVIPQLLWFRKVRKTLLAVFIICFLVNIGMWFERFVIIISIHGDFLPSSWHYYRPTWVDICTFIGTFGIFGSCFLLFLKFVPQIAIAEIKTIMPEADPHKHIHAGSHAPAEAKV